MQIRTGRKNPHTLYIQLGDEPSDDDRSLGYIGDPGVSKWMVRELSDNHAANRRLEAIVIEGER